MRSGRHAFEIRAAVVEEGKSMAASAVLSSTAALDVADLHSDECRVTIDDGKVVSPESSVTAVLRNWQERLAQVQSTLRTSDQVGDGFSSGWPLERSIGFSDAFAPQVGSVVFDCAESRF
jgi:hypothetical protein